ncbi:hypothetical protein [Arcicella rosea]|uniref:Uncharacterized protein n=1 Tax=Arcicella rosea TaxID=502909 RepID=A0A841EVB2_9BACT|nr:hypothetical protein [Arcicella rosea]MBB6003391.1 hypothetical protein [Arcicella rosea]
MKKMIDKLYVCMYCFMRFIKKERANQALASSFLGICFAFNVNTIVVAFILIMFKPTITKDFALFVPLTFAFFYFFNQRYFIGSGRSRELTINLLEGEMRSNRKVLIAITYMFFSIFLFWITPMLLD